ncbi:MAG: NUDIX pyrophosphatase [Ignavibacteriae bacterium]|nr:NUDIX pyrophosphatase [Ignavibacteriota bacterium]NOG98279.1 NUDIX pyrophosphatase [Ignavibacteriota bacterium]
MKVESYLIEAHMFRKTKSGLEYLLLKRASNEKYPGVWQMVTGAVEENEKGYETAIREIKEETNLTPAKFWVVPRMNSFYSPEKNSVCMVPVFATLVEDGEVTLSEEHTEYKWVNKAEAQKLLAWPGQRKSVQIIEDYFTNEQSFLKFVEIEINE